MACPFAQIPNVTTHPNLKTPYNYGGSAQLLFRLTWIKPVLGSLRRSRWRRAAAATTLFVTTSCLSNNFPPSFRPPVSPDNPAALGGEGFPQTVERAVNPSTATIQYVHVDHRRLHVFMAQQHVARSCCLTPRLLNSRRCCRHGTLQRTKR